MRNLVRTLGSADHGRIDEPGEIVCAGLGPRGLRHDVDLPGRPGHMYVAYCASCHGKDGKGDGPAAAALKSAPADLTQLAARNGGKFPENHVFQTIKGDSGAPSHGSKDMPVWGPIFGAMGSKSDAVVQLRVRNLTKYIASLQRK